MSWHEALPPLSDAQMEIMNVVWDRGEATVADVWKVLSARRNLAEHGAHDGHEARGEGMALL